MAWPRWIGLVASGGPVGYSPVAPGTAGSLLGFLIYWLLPSWPAWAWGGFAMIMFFLGVPICTVGESIWGRDAHRIVFDEIVGYWTTMFLLPKMLGIAVLGFFIFRFMDVLKPFPAGRSQRLPGGWGVMMDDLIAGLYSSAVLHGVLLWRGQGWGM